MSIRAGIVVTGTELLTGRITDQNGPWLAERLGDLGVDVTQVICVGDRAGDLHLALGFLADQGVELIVTSGGLGPTADDLTGGVVADFAGVELMLDTDMEQRIADILARFAARMTMGAAALREANRKQAMLPRGATPLDPVGTAPGFVLPTDAGPTVVVLPGPPRELQLMWPAALAAARVRRVLERVDPIGTTRLRLFGVPESDIAETLRDAAGHVDLAGLEIITCLRRSELEVDIRHRAPAEAAAAALVERIADRHGHRLFSRDGSSIDEQVAALLTGHRIATAESCTAGLLAARLTDPPGSSAYVAGGVVAYSNETKVELLGVPAEAIERYGAVSPEVARAMAAGALERFGADLGCGITGVAGPGGGTAAKPVGYVCICVLAADGTGLTRDPLLPGRRADVRERSVAVAMHLIRQLLRSAS
ncbi:competence/damage-inducible protein A [soil metagenome]